MTDDSVLYAVDEGVAWVTLNRPDVLNAIDLPMRDRLWDLLDAVALDPEVRVVVFSGGDRAFCAGADIRDFGTAPSVIDARRARRERDLWGLLLALDKPLIAAIHGYALGAGCELALYCDFRIAAADARIGLPEAALGYIPAAGGTQTLPRTIGPGRALDLILSGDPITADRALEYGLVHRVVPRDELLPSAEALAQRLVEAPELSQRRAKQAVVQGLDLPLVEALRLEARLSGRLHIAPA
jgi:enoyl-CoA hydratase/3-hydroxypropionyl-coenzyme A dehydratase